MMNLPITPEALAWLTDEEQAKLATWKAQYDLEIYCRMYQAPKPDRQTTARHRFARWMAQNRKVTE